MSLPTEVLLNPMLIVSIFLVAATILFFRTTLYASFPGSIPWVGCRKELFSKPRANIRELRHALQFLDEGYANYSKHDKPFVTPNVTMYPEILLPPAHIPWLFNQPDDVLSARAVQGSLIASDYILPHLAFDSDLHVEVARSILTRQLGAFMEVMVEETRIAMDEVLGLDTENWNEVGVSKAVRDILLRVNARVSVGLPLCRDKRYLELSYRLSTAVAICGSLIRALVPNIVKPISCPLFALPCRWYAWRSNRYLFPIISSRIATLELEKSSLDPSSSISQKDPPPNDLLQGVILAALASPSKAHHSLHIISAIFAMLSMAATHPLHITAVHALLDLLSHHSSPYPLDHIREEASRVLTTHSETWTRTAVRQLHRADSAIRESMRFTTLGGRGSMRQVMPAGGIQLPSGETVSQGLWIGAPVHSIHHDSAFYPDATTYQPFRFSATQEKTQLAETDTGAAPETQAKTPANTLLSLTTTSPAFLAFSHGRHACPGRFYAAQLLKLFIAELALRYDIKPLEKRPENIRMSDLTLPPGGVVIMVRRRKGNLEA
ncbi:cytochrome P450, partial [Lepidopterella palustris CBS 459.81]